jgi:hypothetical protein
VRQLLQDERAVFLHQLFGGMPQRADVRGRWDRRLALEEFEHSLDGP